MNHDIEIPGDVPKYAAEDYRDNYTAITKGTGRLMLFAADQKIEHLNQDFYGPGIHPDALNPQHLFNIASQGTIGAFATHLGLITRYGKQYPDINYIVKLNAKTNLVPTTQRDPISKQLWKMHDIIEIQNDTGLNICGVGYTIYLGSEYEHEMLHQAAKIIYEAHEYGLITILWIYPRGKSITHDQDPALIAGAAGVATSLGSDFVKIKPPMPTDEKSSAEHLAVACAAAGNTSVICSGGKAVAPEQFLQELHDQLHIGNTRGSATGRNIFQHALPQAIALTNAIAAIIYENNTVQQAMKIYNKAKV